jgi:hypothetical protein
MSLGYVFVPLDLIPLLPLPGVRHQLPFIFTHHLQVDLGGLGIGMPHQPGQHMQGQGFLGRDHGHAETVTQPLAGGLLAADACAIHHALN